MSKKKQTKTKQKNNAFLFPDSLRGKKYRIIERFRFFDKMNSLLEQYLESENPDYLISAIKEESAILQGPGQTLGGVGIKSSEIDVHTAVWETIRWWQLLRHKESVNPAKDAKRYLEKIGGALANPRTAYIYTITQDEIVHITPKEKGNKTHLEFGLAESYIAYWNRVESAFKAKRKRYGSVTKPLLEEMRQEGIKGIAQALVVRTGKENIPKLSDIKRIIKLKLGDDISDQELRTFKLADISTTTASYIAWKHKKLCDICRKDRLGYKTFLKLHRAAKQKLSKDAKLP